MYLRHDIKLQAINLSSIIIQQYSEEKSTSLMGIKCLKLSSKKLIKPSCQEESLIAVKLMQHTSICTRFTYIHHPLSVLMKMVLSSIIAYLYLFKKNIVNIDNLYIITFFKFLVL